MFPPTITSFSSSNFLKIDRSTLKTSMLVVGLAAILSTCPMIATGHDAMGRDASGLDASGRDASGLDASGLDASGRETTGASSIVLVSQQIAWWTPEEGSDELQLLFDSDRQSDDKLEDSMAENLRQDPFSNESEIEKENDSLKMELIESPEPELEKDPNGDQDEEQNEDQNEEPTERATPDADRFNERLSALRKPAWSLTLTPTPADDRELEHKEPANRAAAFLSDQSPRLVEGSFHPIPRADRVHVPFCHRPTHFQEMNLERCGQLDCERWGCLQNAYSSLWFLTNAAILPYRIGSQSPCQCVRGYGDCLTCQRYDRPIEPLCDNKTKAEVGRGILLQAASMAGFAFLIW